MTTKQWIGIEEAATKYQVSTRRIITWCKRQEIIYSEVRLKATVRAYEMKFRQNGFDNDMFMREAEETNPEIFIPEDIKAAKALLDTPITELKFDIRSQRIISEADIKTLRELLQITSQYGFRKLRDMLRNFGLVSQKKVEKRLKELNVLDVAGNCNLYRYLDE